MSTVAVTADADPKNQCDGCRRRLSLKGDVHFDAEGYPVQGCTKDRYVPTNPVQDYLDAMGEVYMDEMGRLFD